jgi:hypothetical protein
MTSDLARLFRTHSHIEFDPPGLVLRRVKFLVAMCPEKSCQISRINKTIHLLNYVDDEDYRRRILTQLNRGEGRHAVARAICHGKRGEIHQRYREGQEGQLEALGLVTNAAVLWNTIYMNAALSRLRQQGVDVKEEDVARLSPLLYRHINMLGHYSFALADIVRRGVLRPLNADELEIGTSLA